MSATVAQPAGNVSKYPAFETLLDNTMRQNVDDFTSFEKLFVMINTEIPCRYLFGLFKKIIINRQVEKIERLVAFIEYGVKQSSNEFRIHCIEPEFLECWHGLIINSLRFFTEDVKKVDDFYRVLVTEGYSFPRYDTNSSYVVPQEEISAEPTWLQGEWCAMCDIAFTGLRRKHHCRNCGNVVCGNCSAKKSQIPTYNIFNEVRVCDRCFNRLATKPAVNTTCNHSDTTHHPHQCNLMELAMAEANDENVKFYMEDDIERAIQLSLEEAKKHNYSTPSKFNPMPTPAASNVSNKYPDLHVNSSSSVIKQTNHASQSTATPSIISKPEDQSSNYPTLSKSTSGTMNHNPFNPPSSSVDNQHQSVESMLTFFYKTIEMFEQRCHTLRISNQPYSKDYYLQGILQTLLVSHVQVFEILSLNNKEIDDLNIQLSKLDLIKEARATLDDLNREHMEKLRQQKEEADMFLRIQMEQKMELTRQQKKEVEDIQKSLQNKLRININSKLNNYNQPVTRGSLTNNDHSGTQYRPSVHPTPPPQPSIPIHRSQQSFATPTANFNMEQSPYVCQPNMPFYPAHNTPSTPSNFYAYPQNMPLPPEAYINPFLPTSQPTSSNQGYDPPLTGDYYTSSNVSQTVSSSVPTNIAYYDHFASNENVQSVNASVPSDIKENPEPKNSKSDDDPRSKLIDFDP